MKTLAILGLVLGMVPTAMAEVSTRVCLADGNTPLELADPNVPLVYRDIMVGTRLTIIVHSTVGGKWDSDLSIEGQYLDYGLLSARDFNDANTVLDWEGSRFEAAGYGARVRDWEEAGVCGFMLDGHTSATPGDWFIIDYLATKVGTCEVAFYDRSVSWENPVCHLAFSHVATRDFDEDTQVGFADFAVITSYWDVVDCYEPIWCKGADLDTDGDVDVDDLIMFADYWLATTE